jgi:hemolysin III
MTAARPAAAARTFDNDRPQTWAEELANSLSHGLAFLLAVASLPILVSFAAERGSAASVVGACVFSVTMMLLYFTSAMYHALPAGRAKQFFNKLDHAVIYVFIAGSYTPFALGALRGGWGWSLFGVVWGCAVLGVLLKSFNLLRHPGWSTAGAVVFLFDSRVRYGHFVWHLFVMGGSTCHFFAALWHAQ